MCELRSLVHSALEVSSSGEQESFNLFLPPLGRNIKEKHLNLYLNRRKTFGKEKDIIPTHPGIPYNFTDSNPSIPISKPSLSALAARQTILSRHEAEQSKLLQPRNLASCTSNLSKTKINSITFSQKRSPRLTKPGQTLKIFVCATNYFSLHLERSDNQRTGNIHRDKNSELFELRNLVNYRVNIGSFNSLQVQFETFVYATQFRVWFRPCNISIVYR